MATPRSTKWRTRGHPINRPTKYVVKKGRVKLRGKSERGVLKRLLSSMRKLFTRRKA